LQNRQKERPKVLWLSHFAPYPPKGGAEQRSYNMLAELGRGTDLTFVGLAHSSRVKAYYTDFDTGVVAIEAAFREFCTDVRLVKHGHLNRKMNRIFTAFKSLLLFRPYDYVYLQSALFQKQIDTVLAENQFDVIHVDSIGLWQFLNSKDLSAKLILNHHNIESAMLARRAENADAPLSFYLKWQAHQLASIEREACKRAALNIVCSELDASRLRELHSVDNVEVVPNGVDLAYFTRSQPYAPLSKHLLFVGGLDWYPNRDAATFIATKLWPLLKKAMPDITCSIVGRGTITALDELAASDPNFKAPGFADDIRPVFESATIFVCPIRDGGGTKLKVLDAMAMGVPLVAHPVACEGINVEDGQTVRFAESAEDFCSAIVQLLEQPEVLSRMSSDERELIEKNFSYESIGAEIRRMYQ